MRPTSQESSTGGVSPFDIAGAQEFERVAEGVQTISPGGAGAGVRVFKTDDPHFDPVNQRLTDPGAVMHLAPPPEVVAYNLPERGWWRERSPEQVGRQLAKMPDVVIDALRVEVVEAIGDAHRLHRRAVRAHGGDPERAALEGYAAPEHDESVRHAQAVLEVIRERGTR